MSKLSRFKKAPVIKLPKKLPQNTRKNDDSSDDDDDFVSRPFSFKESKNPNPSPKKTSKPSSLESSVSEYFPPSTSKISTRTTSKETSPEKLDKGVSKVKETKRKEGSHVRNLTDSSEISRKKEQKIKESVHPSNSSEESVQPLPDASDNDSEGQGKVQCPFCWKKLSDKLTGTTHIKACAKGAPIQKVIEAMKLQEKQIQEWEQLGIAFPGFSSNVASKKTKKAQGGASSRGRGRTRKKNDEYADPQLELAVALSMSLHEEVETRKAKENQFLIENGLEKEIGLVEIKPAPVQVPEEVAFLRPTKDAPVTLGGGGARRRGKKLPLNQLPLYAVGNEQKKSIICDRVSKMIDESEKDKHQHFYVREQIPSENFGVPKRLVPFHDPESTLWTRAQGGQGVPDESYSVLELPDLKDQLEVASNSVNEDEKIKSGDKEEIPISGKSSPKSDPIKVENSNEVPDKIEMILKNSSKYSVSSSGSIQSTLVSKSKEAISKLPPTLQDIAKMLIARRGCDISLYGREEKAIRCHIFMIAARCPKLLDEIVEEESGKRRRRFLSLTDYSTLTLKAFVWYVYTGQLDSAYDEDMLAELKELASKYGLAFDYSKESESILEKVTTSSMGVQTDVVSTNHVSTMTDTSDRHSIETGFESSEEIVESQELFTTFFEKQDVSRGQDVIECASEIKENEIRSSPSPKSQNASWNEDIMSDGDLFEDIENEMKANTLIRQSTPPPKSCADISVSTKEQITVANESSEELFLDEDCLADLASPVTQWRPSEKKRSRSPLVDTSGGLYTATQIGNMLQMRKEWRDTDDFINKKATKKQKLDNFNEMNSDSKKVNMKSEFGISDSNGDVSINASGGSNRWGDDKKFSDIDYAVIPKQTLLTTPKNNLLKSRRSVSTPNLCVNSPNNLANSPLYNQQIVESNDESDPFADACDDSVFANIPDEILAARKTPEIASAFCKDLGVSKCTSQRALFPATNTRRKHAPRELSACETDESFSTTKSKKGPNGGGRAKPKAKTFAKIKLPSRRHANKTGTAKQDLSSTGNGEVTRREDTLFSQQPLRSSTPNEPSPGQSSKSPMLNYSLVDTPILKQELKKYGIKPLPRSKAKVLLRHIYKETHK